MEILQDQNVNISLDILSSDLETNSLQEVTADNSTANPN